MTSIKKMKRTKPTEYQDASGRPKCWHPTMEEVRNASGAILFGWRCPSCTSQWQLAHCEDCKAPAKLVARISRTKHVCAACKKARRAKGVAPASAAA